jgi:hypothetical protein
MDPGSHDLDALAAFAEGRLEGGDRQRVMAHVADCVECRRTLAQLGRALTDGTLQPGSDHPASHGQWARARVWLPIAASVLVGVFAWFLLTTQPETPAGGDSATPVSEDELLRKRGAGRVIAGKTFRIEGGEWVDKDYDPSRALPVVPVRGSAERSALIARVPGLAPFTELGDRVLVVWDGTVYRFEP